MGIGGWFGSYRYGFNGQEKSIESGDNNYTAQFWEYDSRIGQRWNIDPKSKIGESSYLTFSANPVWLNDPLGDSSVFDNMGNVVHYNKDDKDKRVFMLHDNKLKLLGKIGGTIDVNDIVRNIVAANIPTAQQTSEAGWVFRVLPNTVWDHKNNENTIFGVIWLEDKAASPQIDFKEPVGPFKYQGTTFFGLYSNGQLGAVAITLERRTKFLYKSYTFNGSADFGNYHAGFIGIQQGLTRGTQYWWAGMGEVAKFHSDMGERLWQVLTGEPPVGDQPIDHMWNKRGMTDAEKLLKVHGNPYRVTNTNRIISLGPMH